MSRLTTQRDVPRRRVVIYQDEADKWRWRVVAGNGRVVGASEQGFARRAYAELDARQENPGATLYERVGRRNVEIPEPKG